MATMAVATNHMKSAGRARSCQRMPPRMKMTRSVARWPTTEKRKSKRSCSACSAGSAASGNGGAAASFSAIMPLLARGALGGKL